MQPRQQQTPSWCTSWIFVIIIAAWGICAGVLSMLGDVYPVVTVHEAQSDLFVKRWNLEANLTLFQKACRAESEGYML